jgi:hypothetical protein
LEADYDRSPYTQQGERIARLALSAIRLVIDRGVPHRRHQDPELSRLSGYADFGSLGWCFACCLAGPVVGRSG